MVPAGSPEGDTPGTLGAASIPPGSVSSPGVEESYAAVGRIDPTTGGVELSDDREAPDVVDDLIDDLIEAVLARRGRVAIVPDRTLGDLGPLAMCTRA